MSSWSSYRKQARLTYLLIVLHFVSLILGTLLIVFVEVCLTEIGYMDHIDFFFYTGIGIVIWLVAVTVAFAILYKKLLTKGVHPAYYFRCPRCRNHFFVPEWLRRSPWSWLFLPRCYLPFLLVIRRECIHCGLRKWQEPSGNANNVSLGRSH